MAPSLEENAVKAGHMKAEKVGGMRITRKPRRESTETDNRTPSESSDAGKSDEMKITENILAHSGLAAQTHKDYPEEAVKQSHVKTVPRNQIHNTAPHNNRASGPIFQPKKQ